MLTRVLSHSADIVDQPSWVVPFAFACGLVLMFFFASIVVASMNGRVQDKRCTRDALGRVVEAPDKYRPRHRHADLEQRTTLVRPPLRLRLRRWLRGGTR